jgi:hypothetical protein
MSIGFGATGVEERVLTRATLRRSWFSLTLLKSHFIESFSLAEPLQRGK